MNVGTRIRTFIVDDLRWQGDQDLTDDLPIIVTGVVDSLGMYELVTMLETEYGIVVADDEVLPENFGSIGAIVRFVQTKR